MSRSKMSEFAMGVLDAITEAYGDIELTEDGAERICGRKGPVQVKDLTPTELLQYALFHSYVEREALLVKLNEPRPNRAARRKKLILP